MAKNAIVYASRNRLTGTLCQTIDTLHKDSPIPFNAKKGRYAARCVEHKATVFFSEHYPAGRAIAHVDEWCKRCIAMIAAGKRVANKRQMVTGKASASPEREDLRMVAGVSGNRAYDKKWRNGPTKRNTKTETQRKHDIAGSHDVTKRIAETIAIAESIAAAEAITE